MNGRRMTVIASLALLGLLLATVAPIASSAGRRVNADTPWRAQSSGTERDLISVSAADSNTAWAAGGDALSPTTPAPGSGVLLKTSDGGANWTDQTAPNASTYSGVSAAGPNTAWSVEANNIWKTADGQKWNKQYTYDGGPGPTGQGGVLYGVHAVDGNVVWAVGLWVHVDSSGWPWQAHMHGVILKTIDGGANWSVQMGTDLPPNNVALSRLAAADSNNAWAVGTDGKILHTIDGGANWVDQVSPVPHTNALGICAVDAGTAWMVGQHAEQGVAQGVAMSTIDSGSNWVLRHEGGEYIAGVSAVDPQTAWVAGSGGSILKTYDGGVGWNNQESPTTEDLSAVDSVDACTAWAVGTQGVILRTDNGGDEKPDVATVEPAGGPPGAIVAINGSDFGTAGPDAYVSFGSTRSTEYPEWSGGRVKCRVPDVGVGGVHLSVTTPAGTSNSVPFTVTAFSVTGINPNWVYQNNVLLNFELAGTGFQPGATVRLRKGATVIDASSAYVVSESELKFSLLGIIGYGSGSYDVVVHNPDGTEATLPAGLEIRPSACGMGGGAAFLLSGIIMGLLSVTCWAGVSRSRKGRTPRDS